MIRLRLLWPVNPKTDAKKCDPITIGAMLWLVDDENRAGLLLIKPRCFVRKNAPTKRSINQLTSGMALLRRPRFGRYQGKSGRSADNQFR